MLARLLPALAAACLALTVVGAARADVADEPPPDADECSVDEKCPDTGVLCGGESCFGDDQCPGSAVECDWREDGAVYTACIEAAEALGLEERCDGQTTVYCDPDEAPPEGSAAACARDAEEAGLEKRCVDEGYDDVWCDPGEDEPGCAVETVGGPRARRGALAAFLVAAVATVARAARRRRG